MNRIYLHGYDRRERIRLQDQADSLVDLLHSDTAYPEGSRILEAGCGIGAQTISLARHSPRARIVSIDISADSIAAAKAKTDAAGFDNVQFQQADISPCPSTRSPSTMSSSVSSSSTSHIRSMPWRGCGIS